MFFHFQSILEPILSMIIVSSYHKILYSGGVYIDSAK